MPLSSPRPSREPELSHSGSERPEHTGLLMGGPSGGGRSGSGGFGDEVRDGLGVQWRTTECMASLVGSGLAVPSVPSVEAEDLPEASLWIWNFGHHRRTGSEQASASACLRLLPSPASALPSFLCLLGRDPQWPAAWGRERGRWGLGGGLPPGNVTLPGPRIAPGPKPRARPGTRR